MQLWLETQTAEAAQCLLCLHPAQRLGWAQPALRPALELEHAMQQPRRLLRRGRQRASQPAAAIRPCPVSWRNAPRHAVTHPRTGALPHRPFFPMLAVLVARGNFMSARRHSASANVSLLSGSASAPSGFNVGVLQHCCPAPADVRRALRDCTTARQHPR